MTPKYEYRVGWSEEDQIFIARVTEFPSLAAHGETPKEALDEIQMVVDTVVEDLEENQEPIPEPLTTRTYSGKLNVRMPESLHRELAIEAAREGISINQLINLKLSQSLSRALVHKRLRRA